MTKAKAIQNCKDGSKMVQSAMRKVRTLVSETVGQDPDNAELVRVIASGLQEANINLQWLQNRLQTR